MTTTTIREHPNIRWFILLTVSVGTFMSTLDSSIVNVALPTISTALKTDLQTLQWVVTGYLLTISSLLPIFGRLADLLGRKRIFSMGFILFTIGSALCGLSSNVFMLIGFRVFQALGASMLMANSQAIIVAAFSTSERGRALGLTGTTVALGSLTGPAIGGLIVGLIGWEYIFYINVPIGIIGFIVSQIILPDDKPVKDREPFDFSGALLFSLGMVALLFAINNGEDYGWSSVPILLGIAAGLILLISFFVIEQKVKVPMINLSLYKIKPFAIGNISGFLSFVATFCNTMLMPFVLQHSFNWTPEKIGLLMATYPVVMAIIAPTSGYLSDKIGPVFLTTGGLLINGLGLFFLATLQISSPFWYIMIGTILMGLGSGMFQSPNNSSVMGAVPKHMLGTAGGLNALVRNVGMVVGTTLAVSVFDARQNRILAGMTKPTMTQQIGASLSAYHTVMIIGGVISLTAAFLSMSRKGYLSSDLNKAHT
ncbi:drug resistance transporter, EmrB/QacA subfamily [Desulfosporosinus acidiphilus SJ4]|uniref:Drug resistance transporter, EmrB/QacA subfamily n=1 Tax=Desulfosporosinus acidiphilus (strain DSM 22704 / JCM 16185 / SJ4) TaxID=646529 RepID=I4D9K0_DESAJ|nr:MFS transporter [Desulfosporosinus acidiphilus]AFM42474.1 drug resistance transporter, EmrB/QacA subfamily [Desulfosporosinus acidiphilus SJ4]